MQLTTANFRVWRWRNKNSRNWWGSLVLCNRHL